MTDVEDALDEESRLIHRALERSASAQDWQRLQRLGSGDPALWLRLAEALQDETRLAAALEESLAAADAVDLPPLALAAGRRASWWSWSGWGVAATLLALLLVQRGQATPSPALGRLLPQAQPALWQPLAELPSRVVESRPASDGQGWELIYVRQVLERTVVDDVYRWQLDDGGQRRSVPLDAGELLTAGWSQL